jgi:RimJ/RimL family protein N-acetyltransferase
MASEFEASRLAGLGVLCGRLVRLRPFTPADITDDYLRWLNDPAVMRFSNQRFLSHDRASSLRYLASFAGTDNLLLSVRRRDSDQAIGTLTAYVSRHHGTADVGILIGETTVWGHGYGQSAWDTLTDWLLGDARVRKLTAGTLASNTGMLKLLERSGMKLEAVRKAQEIVDGRPEDVLYFARFRDA